MSSIKLHPTKGVNPHLGLCPRCGKDSGDILLLGTNDKKFVCNRCDLTSYGASHCLKCLDQNGETKVIQEGEKIPSHICKECETEVNDLRAVVEAGGIFFECKDCGANGVIRKTDKEGDFASEVRTRMKMPAPQPCGIRFSETNCPQCGPKEENVDAPAKD